MNGESSRKEKEKNIVKEKLKEIVKKDLRKQTVLFQSLKDKVKTVRSILMRK